MEANRKCIALIAAAAGGIAMIAVGLWIWLRPSPYTDCVPEEAKAVLEITPSQLQTSQEALRAMRKWLPTGTAGIDTSLPVYAFITPNEYMGLTASVSDSHEVEKSFRTLTQQQKCTFLPTEGGTHWVWLNAGWLIAWDSHKLWALGPSVASERETLRQIMRKMPDEGKSFFDTTAGEKLQSQKGAIRLYATLDALPSPYNMLLRISIPADIDPASVQLFSTIDFSDRHGTGRTLVESRIDSENEQTLAHIDRMEQQNKGISLSASSREMPLFFMATSTNGERLLSLIRTDHQLRDLLLGLNQAFDADKILKAIDGRLTLEISQLKADWSPTFCLKGDTKQRELFADAPYWIESAAEQEGMALHQLSPSHFSLDYEKSNLQFGQTRDRSIFFCSAEGQEMACRDFRVSYGTGCADDTLSYFRINLSALFRQPCMKGTAAQWIKMLLPGKKSITYTTYKGRKSRLCIEQ